MRTVSLFAAGLLAVAGGPAQAQAPARSSGPAAAPAASLRPQWPTLPAGFRSAPYAPVDAHSRIAGTLQRLYRQWAGSGDGHPTAAHLRAAFPELLVNPDGARVLVRVTLRDEAALREPLAGRGFGVVSAKPRQHFVEGWLPIGQLAPGEAGLSHLAPLGLMGVLPVLRPGTNGGLFTNQADYVHEAARVRASAGHFDGTGVRIGVMSDSYDNLGGAAAGVASGDLPAGLQVLQDLPSGGSDEGRGMCELVHDVAPGSPLAFSSVFLGEGNFADQIRALAGPAGGNCKVITDDVYYFTEPWFQDGVIAQAVEQAVAGGAAYFSSAGNSADESCEWAAPTFVPGPGGTGLLDFDPGAGTDTRQLFSLPTAQFGVALALQWSAPHYTTGGVQTDLDMYLLNAAGDTVAAATDDNRLTQTPFEFLQYNPDSTQTGSQYHLLIVSRAGGPVPTRVKYRTFGVAAQEWLTQSGTVVGHAGAVAAQAVAAAPFYNRLSPEGFTSKGALTILFDSTGGLLPAPENRPKPNITAVDGCATTFFASQLNSTAAYFFFGTSAAAPNAAAVAALLRQAEPALTPAQVYARLAATAQDMLTPGPDDLTGAGLINAYAAIFGPAAPVAPGTGLFADLDAAAARVWEIGGSGNARGAVRGNLGPASGRGALVLDAGHFGSTFGGGPPPLANNAATLRLNLTSPPAGGWALTFRHKKFAGETDNLLPATAFPATRVGDGVVLSVDGGLTWYRLVQLTGAVGSTTTWQTTTVDVSQFALTNNLTLTADTRIRFMQAGAGLVDGPMGAPAGGRSFDDVRVAPASAPAVALFTSSRPLVGCPGLSVQFQEAAIGAAPGSTYAWTFQGGTPATATGPNPTAVFNAPGHHSVGLTVTGSGGASATRLDTGYVYIYGRRPAPTFGSTSRRLFCPGGQVQFSSDVQYCPAGISWSFPGGTPATSTAASPLVTYATPGTFAVTLTATNTFGATTATEARFVTVTTGALLPLAETFTAVPVPAQWEIQNPDNLYTWEKIDSVINSSGQVSGAMRIRFQPYAGSGQHDVLQSLPLDLRGLPRATLRFDVAYQPLALSVGAVYNDSLAVDIHEFCTLNWLGRVYAKGAYNTLGTVPPSTAFAAYLPRTAADWRTEGVDLAAWLGQKIVVRFVAINSYGNDLFLDNVVVNDRPLALSADAMVAVTDLWPNPVAAGTALRLRLPANAGPARATLLDGLGRVVWSGPLAAGTAGQTLMAPRAAGLYSLRIVPATGVPVTRRVVVE